LDDPESLYHDLHLELLKITPSCPPFISPSIPQFSNLLLHSSGFSFNDVGEPNLLHLCKECTSQLRLNKLPRFALANNFYRGELPEEFKDLTWVEEMACAIYRNTAHISHIYQSSDPSQPRVFHGNTCAHDMNVVSTATVLPRTPDDVNDMLSVVFIGPGKYKPDCLKTCSMFVNPKFGIFLFG
jgi:hypothetical protein